MAAGDFYTATGSCVVRTMNMTLLHTDDGDRYGQLRLDGTLVVYDRENANAWARVASATEVRT